MIDLNTNGEFISRINPYDTNKALGSLVAYYRLLTSNDPSIRRISLDKTIGEFKVVVSLRTFDSHAFSEGCINDFCRKSAKE